MRNLRTIKPLIAIGWILISYAEGQAPLAPDYEFFFQTKDVPDGTTVHFSAENSDSPRWDEDKYVATGTDVVTIEIFEDDNSCSPDPHAFDRGGDEEPSIGFLRYVITVTNQGQNAWFVLEAQGQDFLGAGGDKYFTYDWDDDLFLTGGSCGSYGTSGIEDGTVIVTNVDDEQGNLQFQPTNPTNLTLTIVNNHPKLDWAASKPSFTTIKYKVQRRPFDESWSTIASNISNTTYTDNEVFTNIIRDRKRYYYRVKAYTSYPKYSPGYSNTVSVLGVLLLKQQSSFSEPVSEQQTLPVEFSSLVYPNPFNSTTVIKYNMPGYALVELKIYDIMGRDVTTLVNGFVNAGFKEVIWDGTNASGQPVPSGMYFYRLDAKAVESGERFHQTRKMVMMR